MGTEAAAAGLPQPLDREPAAGELAEARKLSWRKPVTQRTLRREGRHWTLWTLGVVVTFGLPSVMLLALSPWTFPAALLWSAHGAAIVLMQPRRGVRSVVAIGSERSAARSAGADAEAEGIALGLLGDLLGHPERELVARTGLAMQRGEFGVWLVGEQGAMLVRPGGRRVDAWCVRVDEPGDLPGGDRVAHLLLALREDEVGFATVANLNFSGAAWRVRWPMRKAQRPALDAARSAAQQLASRKVTPSLIWRPNSRRRI